MKTLQKIYTFLIFFILYIPIVVLVLFSFNSSGNTGSMTGLSLYWYRELFATPSTFTALKNTLILALSTSVIATLVGTAAAVGIGKFKNKAVRGAVLSVTNVPMMNPDIVTGISMMLLFVLVGSLIGLKEKLGFWTILIAHITFCLPYVILSVRPRVLGLNRSLSEAAMDLGCTPVSAFFRVELPAIMPGIISGFIMAFTLSLDDFVISYFTTGNDFQTLPLLIYSMTKKEVTPDIYALSTLMIAAVLILLILSNVAESKGKNKENEPSAKMAERIG